MTKLAASLVNSVANIYLRGKALGVTITDETFEGLRVVGIFRCESCNRWLPTSLETATRSEFCHECRVDILW